MKKSIIFFSLILIILTSSCDKFSHSDALFSELSSSKSGINFVNKLLEKKAFGILYYLYYFNGGGVSIGDINNDGLQDVYFTSNNKSANKLYLNKGNLKFEDITEKAGVAGKSDWCTGVTMADINGDGLLDIYVSAVAKQHGLQGHNELFINQGNLTFKEQSAEYGLNFEGFSTQSAFFDYDHDGDLDCYLLNQSLQPNQNIRKASGRNEFDENAGDRFYRNENGKKFTDISKEAGILQSNLGYGLGLSIADFNNDGFEDIYIGNDFHENDYYYLNNTKGGFVESGEKHFRHYSRFSMGNDAADYDNDGNIDIVTVDMLPDNEKTLKTYGSDEQFDSYQYKIVSNGYQYQYSRNCLQNNNGNGESFSEVGLLAGISATDWSWCPLFVDFDNDSNKDLFVSSGIVKRPVDLDYVKYISDMYIVKGMNKTDKYDADALDKMPDGASHPFFFKGDGEGNFSDVSEKWGTGNMKGYYNGSAYGDMDNDGDMDVIINKIGTETTFLVNNTKKSDEYLAITFEGNKLNKFGIGAKAYVFSNHKMQFQQLESTHGFESSSQNILHFGLGEKAKIDSVIVVWPGQKMQVIKNITANKSLKVQENNATKDFNFNLVFPPKPLVFENITDKIHLNWTHKENFFNDFSRQPLMPHMQSTRGPKIAIGDFNNDNLDDFYVCGSAGQAGAMMMQNGSGGFMEIAKSTFEMDAASEDVDAVIFDANNDGKNDLLVVSGGNEKGDGSKELIDRLYINQGNNSFSKSNTFPQIAENKGCVSVADIDKDGDIDIFMGGKSSSFSYGILGHSYLLINDGKGNFSKSVDANLANLGMVNSAQFEDLDHDSWPDLVLAGEFMPITILKNNKGKFEKIELTKSSGWWQGIKINDINNDGKLDILAGNWGLNNKFSSQKDGIVKMYVKDFDKNNNVDQLLSYSIKGKEYPYLAKDEVERVMPVLRQHYKLYTDFAGLEMKDAYYGFAEQVTPLEINKLSSSIYYGKGNFEFEAKDLPKSLQKAPIYSFLSINKEILIGGNFYESQPYEGRYDAQSLALFDPIKNLNIKQSNLNNINGQVRDIKILRKKDHQKIILVALNNAPIQFFSIK